MANDIASLSHEELFRMREGAPAPDQQLLAPLEHQAFAREYASENPFQAIGLLAGIPGYQAAKSLGLLGSRTGGANPIDQMFAGYTGLGQGWLRAARRGFGAMFPSAQAAGPTGAPMAPTTYVGASPIDRRGPFFGAPPLPAGQRDSLLGPIGPAERPTQRTGPGAVPPIPGYEREFRVIQGQTGGLVPHQGIQ